MRLPKLGVRADGRRCDTKKVTEHPCIAPSDIACTANGWCKCKDEGGTRTASGDSSGTNTVECCVNAKDKLREACDAICVNIGGRDKYEPCICSADPDLYECGPH